MKLLKNLGWFLLAILSFYFGYGLVQSMAVEALKLGAFTLCCYLALCGLGWSLCVRYLQMVSEGPVRIEKSGFNRFIWLPALVWFLSLVIQFFLPNDPSVNQQIAIDLTFVSTTFLILCGRYFCSSDGRTYL